MIALSLRNDSEMVFSAVPATEGGHHGLGYIPGQAIWGAFAARVYADPACRARAFDLVHSGKVRFSPGYPATADGAPAFPWPQCLQYPKHAPGAGSQRRFWNVLNGQLIDNGTRVQTEVPKGCFVGTHQQVARPGLAERGKSAIMPGHRRVAEAQFFQYQHLGEGSSWVAWIDADDPKDEVLAYDLLARSPISVGRSKRREYGGDVRVDRADTAMPAARGTIGGHVVLWCLSDIALLNQHGMPNLSPDWQSLGVGGVSGQLSASLSLISTRRFAPYNMHLRARDREMTVIEAGSVLVYTDASPVDATAFAKGLGLWRERGLGRVLVNPQLLTSTEGWPCSFDWPGVGQPVAARSMALPSSPDDAAMLATLRARAGMRGATKSIDKAAVDIAASLRGLIRDVRMIGYDVPAPSQWSRVADAADTASTKAALVTLLFQGNTGQLPICAGRGKIEWDQLRSPLRGMIEQAEGDAAGFMKALGRACRLIARDEARQGEKA